MNDSDSSAHLKITDVFLSPEVETFILSSPPDDRELVIQAGIDELLVRVSGGEAPDFSRITQSSERPVFASRITLNALDGYLSVTIIGRFDCQSSFSLDDQLSFYQIYGDIFVGREAEIDDVLEEWYSVSGIVARFI